MKECKNCEAMRGRRYSHAVFFQIWPLVGSSVAVERKREHDRSVKGIKSVRLAHLTFQEFLAGENAALLLVRKHAEALGEDEMIAEAEKLLQILARDLKWKRIHHHSTELQICGGSLFLLQLYLRYLKA